MSTISDEAADRKWLPTEWADEVSPTPEESPDKFIERDGERWVLRPPVGNAFRDEEYLRIAIEPGQVVDFMATEHFGYRIVTVNTDRTFSVDRPYPEKTTHFWGGDDQLAHTLAELVNGDPELPGMYDPLEPGEHEIAVYWWSDSLPFRFDVDSGGNGRFVSCSGAN